MLYVIRSTERKENEEVHIINVIGARVPVAVVRRGEANWDMEFK